jgi:flagellar hook-associated protein 2
MSSVSSTSSSSALSSTDWSALIEGAVAAKLAPKTSIEARITKNESKITAYEKLQSLLSDISDAAYTLSAPSGFLGQSEDVFNSRTAYLTTDGTYTASNVLGVSVDSNTELGNYSVEIDQIATAHKVTSKDVSSSSGALSSYTSGGTFSIGLDGMTAATITVTGAMSLSDVASAINATTSTSGVKATVLKVSDTSYQLVLTGTETGKSILASDSTGTVLNDLEIASAPNTFTHQLQQAKDAIFYIDGVQITRDSNTVTDALDGVTFYLYAPTDTGTSVNVEVSADLSTIQTQIQSLVDAYNAYRDFVVAQQVTASDGTAASSSVLFGDSTVRAVNNDVMNALNTIIGDDNMSLLGLSFDSTNHLTVDTSKLQDSLLNDLDQVKSLLAFSYTSSSDSMRILNRGSSAPTSFALDITTDGSGNVTAASVGGDSSLFTVSGTSIKGVEGTAYEGFTFIYIGGTSTTINVSLSYGLAEKLNKAVTNASQDSIQTVIDNLTDKNTDYESDISKIETRADALRTTLTNRYASYQAKIAKAESTLAYLKAMLDAANNN